MTTTDGPGLLRLDSAPSTMDVVHRLGEEGAPAGAAVVAAEQTAGRGSRGRPWTSPRGGLWMSVLLRPAREAAELLSLRAGLAVAEGLESGGAVLRVGIKWPNDLMWRDRKLGGVLCEVRWAGDAPAWAAVGVGINVRNPLAPGLGAVALEEMLADVGPDQILEVVLPRLRALENRTGALTPDEQARLARRDWLLGRRLVRPVEGTAAGIAPDGALLVRRVGGELVEVRAGTLELADPAVAP